jgi:hypothetical protein
MNRRNVLVFPAGTEIGLEILNALKHSKEVKLFGAGQNIPNHANFAYPEYHHLPSIHEANWLDHLIALCKQLAIDYVFPAHDDVIVALSRRQACIPAKVISSPADVCETTRSKSLTYRRLGRLLRVPTIYDNPERIASYPVFVKPDKGQGSFGVRKVHNQNELLTALSGVPDAIICEYLPGEEFTVDCFSDRDRGVLFAQARSRRRTRNGISVNTVTEDLDTALYLAQCIHNELQMRGAWFYQIKRAHDGELALLEVAPRIAGAMATHRAKGVNFPLLSIFEEERLPLSVLVNPGKIELDRALGNRYQHTVRFSTLYVDLDDTLVLDDQVNIEIIRLIFQSINLGKRIKLLTRHRDNLSETLTRHRLNGLFDEIIHLNENEPKSTHITESDAIFIDDSFSERQEVWKTRGILTFDCSMVELLTQQAEHLNGAHK